MNTTRRSLGTTAAGRSSTALPAFTLRDNPTLDEATSAKRKKVISKLRAAVKPKAKSVAIMPRPSSEEAARKDAIELAYKVIGNQSVVLLLQSAAMIHQFVKTGEVPSTEPVKKQRGGQISGGGGGGPSMAYVVGVGGTEQVDDEK